MGMIRRALPLLLAACASGSGASTTDYRMDAKTLYTRLVAFQTVAGRGQVVPMVTWLRDYLRERGVPQAGIVILPHKDTAALIVRIEGSDPTLKPILFSAHTDVVEAKSGDWGSDPFALVEKDGSFHGRGAYDNKAGVVALISALRRALEPGHHPRRTLVFAFPGDEESALETSALIAAHPWVRGAEFAINTDAGHGQISDDGRPLIYLVQGAEKTYASFEISVTNPGGHSSRPRTDNAIYDLARVVARLESYRFPAANNRLTAAYLAAMGRVTPGATGAMLRRFAANPADDVAAEALFAEPDFVGSTRTTCIPTMLAAGHAENALPQAAALTVNCRIFPGETVSSVQSRLTDAIGDPRARIRVLHDPQPSPESPMRADVMAAIARAVHSQHPGVTVAPYLETGATDGRRYRIAGIPTFGSSGIFYQPGRAALHGRDEHLPVAAFYESIDHIRALAKEFGAR